MPVGFEQEATSAAKELDEREAKTISNNSFIDGLIHRQMRKSLLESFDEIYILDLHGNAKKKETAPDGGRDEITLIDIMAHVGEESAAVGSLKSPMPGQVVAFKVAVGDTVKKGEPLAVIEAMKIEHTITAPTDGLVAELLFAAGDLVADGDELLRIDTEASEA